MRERPDALGSGGALAIRQNKRLFLHLDESAVRITLVPPSFLSTSRQQAAGGNSERASVCLSGTPSMLSPPHRVLASQLLVDKAAVAHVDGMRRGYFRLASLSLSSSFLFVPLFFICDLDNWILPSRFNSSRPSNPRLVPRSFGRGFEI
jgi:hypothetical protein